MSRFYPQGMGWIPDLPDPRDYTFRHSSVLPLLARLNRAGNTDFPDVVSLERDQECVYFTAPLDQGPLHSASAFAILSMIEYFERRVCGRAYEASHRFLYKVTRNLNSKRRRVTGDTGTDLRTTLKVLTQIGVPSHEYWPYDVASYDEEPSQFLYSLARPMSDLIYFRLDESNRDGATTWNVVTSFLEAGFPVAFGFSVPSSITAEADIHYRADLDSICGGQAVVAVGYQRNHFGRGQHALLIRSSWGSQWGNHGNGWLPDTFVRKQMARDFWTLISASWLDSGELTRPSVID